MGESTEAFEAEEARLVAREADAAARREKNDDRIRDLGTLDKDALAANREAGEKALRKAIAKVGRRLDKYKGRVNLKASDEYQGFAEEQTRLEARRKVRPAMQRCPRHRPVCLQPGYRAHVLQAIAGKACGRCPPTTP